MNPRLLAIGKPPRMEILDRIKRSRGMSAQELADALALSYMGVKQHCEALLEEGLLDSWRRSKAVGRPEKIFRLTPNGNALFPSTSNAATLELLSCAAHLYGPSAPEKLLYAWFERRKATYGKRVRGEGLEVRLRSLARAREEEGCLPAVEPGPWRLVEFHCPLQDLREAYPAVTRMETAMLSAALGVPVRREEETVAGLFRCEFIPEQA